MKVDKILLAKVTKCGLFMKVVLVYKCVDVVKGVKIGIIFEAVWYITIAKKIKPNFDNCSEEDNWRIVKGTFEICERKGDKPYIMFTQNFEDKCND